MEDLDRRRNLVEDRLEEVLAAVDPPALARSLDHVTLAGGKRIRPTVTVLTCEALGGQPHDAIDYAVGIELVHTASLVVDDIIDESRIRRGEESAWVAFGHGPAIIASDGLLGEAFELFADEPAALDVVTEALIELGQGEAVELVDYPSTEAEYRSLARRKTGALFRAAAKLGAIAAEQSDETIDAMGEYAERVGIAFQMRDDVLDATAESEKLGKPTGRDVSMERPSLLRVTGVTPAEANDRARVEADAAVSALGRVDGLDGQARTYLTELASFAVERDR